MLRKKQDSTFFVLFTIFPKWLLALTTENFQPAKTASSSSRYEIFLEDLTWEQANERCLDRGGHLVTITSKAEEAKVIALAEAKESLVMCVNTNRAGEL